MTTKRYGSYQAVRRFLKSVVEMGREDREILLDAAEGLLLARPGREEDAAELVVGVELVLNQLVLTGRWDAEHAERLRTMLLACGPAEELPPRVAARDTCRRDGARAAERPTPR